MVGVVTQPDRPVGRGQKVQPSPVRRLAQQRGIPVAAPEKIRSPEFLSALAGWAPHLIVVVAYGRILPRSILDLSPGGCLNVHYSLLPKYRGAAPIPWAIIAGEEKSGVTTMRLVEKMDAGPIFLQEAVELSADETAASLEAKLIPLGARLLLDTLQRLEQGTVVAAPQREEEATLAPMLKKEDGCLDWALAAEAIERRIRAFDPWPGAFTYCQGRLMKIYRARVVSDGHKGSAGDVVRADAGGLWVATGVGVLSLEETQFENRKRLAAAEFIKGARIAVGERLGAR